MCGYGKTIGDLKTTPSRLGCRLFDVVSHSNEILDNFFAVYVVIVSLQCVGIFQTTLNDTRHMIIACYATVSSNTATSYNCHIVLTTAICPVAIQK